MQFSWCVISFGMVIDLSRKATPFYHFSIIFISSTWILKSRHLPKFRWKCPISIFGHKTNNAMPNTLCHKLHWEMQLMNSIYIYLTESLSAWFFFPMCKLREIASLNVFMIICFPFSQMWRKNKNPIYAILVIKTQEIE